MKTIFTLLILLVSISANAGGWLTSDGSAVVDSVSSENGIVTVRFSANDAKDPEGCNQKGVFVLIDDTKNGDRQFSILLAAKISKTPVKIYANGCYSGWGKMWPKLWMVMAS